MNTPSRPYSRNVKLFILAAIGLLNTQIADAQASKLPASVFSSTIWSRLVEPILDFNISPNGKYVALITRSGRLSVWDGNTGIPLWSVNGITERNVLVSDINGDAAVYNRMDRIDKSILVYGPVHSLTAKNQSPVKGKALLKAVMNGAIWSSDISPDGSSFVFGDGLRQVRLIELMDKPHALESYPVDGIANDVKFTSDGEAIVVGLWNQSGVEVLDLAGHILSSYLGPNVRRFNVVMSPDDSQILALAFYNRQNLHPIISLLDQNASVKWSFDPGEDTSNASALLGDAAIVSYISYTKTTRHLRKPSETTRLLSAVDSTGNVLWSKGGLFLQFWLISVAPYGQGVIVCDGNQTLYDFNSDGSLQSRLHLPFRLQQLFAITRNRKCIIVYLVDGTLIRINIS